MDIDFPQHNLKVVSVPNPERDIAGVDCGLERAKHTGQQVAARSSRIQSFSLSVCSTEG
jgi:hypothetical protein